MTPPEPSWRKPVGALIIIGLVIALCAVIMVLSDMIAGLPLFFQFVIFIVAGLAWIAPLKPLLLWMETGRWRRP